MHAVVDQWCMSYICYIVIHQCTVHLLTVLLMFKCCLLLQLCTDLRLLASMKEIEEPFETEQIGKLFFETKQLCKTLHCDRVTVDVLVFV